MLCRIIGITAFVLRRPPGIRVTALLGAFDFVPYTGVSHQGHTSPESQILITLLGTHRRIAAMADISISTDEQIRDQWGTDLVLVEQSKRWPNQLIWSNVENELLRATYSDYLSRYGSLNEIFMIEGLVDQLRKDGYNPVFAEDTAPVLYDFARWHAPLTIDGLDLRKADGTKSDLYEYQRFSINRAMERIQARHRHDRFFFFGWGLGTGKMNPVSEPVLTPTGWRTMGELRPGHSVIGANGKSTRVVSIHPQGSKPVYRVTMNDGSFVRCGDEHLWNIRRKKIKDRGQGRRPEPEKWRTWTTRQIMDDIVAFPHRQRWQLPALEPVEFDDLGGMTVDPYTLGVYLGDGNSQPHHMRITTDEWIAQYLGWQVYASGRRGEYTVVSPVPLETRHALEALGLLGLRSWEKFVPDAYLHASIPNRWALLRGLLDTDGHPMRAGGIEYSTTSPYLRDAVVDLVRGLGGRARVSEREGHYTKSGERHEARTNWRIHINISGEAFLLPRKRDAWTPPTKYQPTKTIVSVEPEGVSEEQVCIVVDAADSLYVTRGHNVTHNSAACAAGALEALNQGHVDLVLAFTMRKLKFNLRDFFTRATPLDAVVCDGTKPKREKLWADQDTKVFVNNYDKAWWDHDQMMERVRDKRVLFIFDEVEVLLTDDRRTRVRKAIDELMAKSKSTAWPMSGSIVDASPLTYHDNYNLGCTSSGTHPLGTRKSFIDLYRESRESRSYANPHGPGHFTVHEDHWDVVGLQEVRHRVAHCTQNARKTDPGVRENFPGVSTEIVRIQLSEQDRKLYEILREHRNAALRRQEPTGEHLELMRYVCNHPGALGITRYALGQQLAAEHPKLINGKNCSKLEVFCDQVEAIAAAGEQCIGFTKWTGLSLHLVATELERRKIRFVKHHGAMSDTAAYLAQEDHRKDPRITLFWSSDAGSHGLNMQHCRYVINYECPRAWKRLNQRMSRIDRADGSLDGRTNYIYVTDHTIEVGIKETNDARRELASATMGTVELDSYDNADAESVGRWDDVATLIASEERTA